MRRLEFGRDAGARPFSLEKICHFHKRRLGLETVVFSLACADYITYAERHVYRSDFDRGLQYVTDRIGEKSILLAVLVQD